MTHEVGDFDYRAAKSKTKPSFKMALAVSSTSHDGGDRVTRLIKTKKAMPRRFTLVSHKTQGKAQKYDHRSNC